MASDAHHRAPVRVRYRLGLLEECKFAIVQQLSQVWRGQTYGIGGSAHTDRAHRGGRWNRRRERRDALTLPLGAEALAASPPDRNEVACKAVHYGRQGRERQTGVLERGESHRLSTPEPALPTTFL